MSLVNNQYLDNNNESDNILTNEKGYVLNELEELGKLREENLNLKEKINDFKERFLYNKAEIDNVRKKNLIAIEVAKQKVCENIFCEFLNVVDSLEYGLLFEKFHSFSNIVNNDDLFLGLRVVYETVMNFFNKFDIHQINPLGLKFDPIRHEAIALKDSDSEFIKNNIIEVIQKGYVVNGTILRHPKVVVAK